MILEQREPLSDRIVLYTNVMIAPEANDGKGLEAGPADHGFVSKIIKLPNFGQGAAKLASKITPVTSGPVSRERRIPQPPSPPGLEQTGPVVSRTVQSPTL
jgi:hypothetical protein